MGHVLGIKDSGAWGGGGQKFPRQVGEYVHIHTSGELSRWDKDPFPVCVRSALAATI